MALTPQRLTSGRRTCLRRQRCAAGQLLAWRRPCTAAGTASWGGTPPCAGTHCQHAAGPRCAQHHGFPAHLHRVLRLLEASGGARKVASAAGHLVEGAHRARVGSRARVHHELPRSRVLQSMRAQAGGQESARLPPWPARSKPPCAPGCTSRWQPSWRPAAPCWTPAAAAAADERRRHAARCRRAAAAGTAAAGAAAAAEPQVGVPRAPPPACRRCLPQLQS